jgi:hypothetical protein
MHSRHVSSLDSALSVASASHHLAHDTPLSLSLSLSLSLVPPVSCVFSSRSTGYLDAGTLLVDAMNRLESIVQDVKDVASARTMLRDFLAWIHPHPIRDGADSAADSFMSLPQNITDRAAESDGSISSADTASEADTEVVVDGSFAPHGGNGVIEVNRNVARSTCVTHGASADTATRGGGAAAAPAAPKIVGATPGKRSERPFLIGSCDLTAALPPSVKARLYPTQQRVNVVAMEKQCFGKGQLLTGVDSSLHILESRGPGGHGSDAAVLDDKERDLCTDLNEAMRRLLIHAFNETETIILEDNLQRIALALAQCLSNALDARTRFVDVSKRSGEKGVPAFYVETTYPTKSVQSKEGGEARVYQCLLNGKGDGVGLSLLKWGEAEPAEGAALDETSGPTEVATHCLEFKRIIKGSAPCGQCGFGTIHLNGRNCYPPVWTIDDVEAQSAFLCVGTVTNGLVGVGLAPVGYLEQVSVGQPRQFFFFVEMSGTALDDGAFHLIAKQIKRSMDQRKRIESSSTQVSPPPRAPESPVQDRGGGSAAKDASGGDKDVDGGGQGGGRGGRGGRGGGRSGGREGRGGGRGGRSGGGGALDSADAASDVPTKEDGGRAVDTGLADARYMTPDHSGVDSSARQVFLGKMRYDDRLRARPAVSRSILSWYSSVTP